MLVVGRERAQGCLQADGIIVAVTLQLALVVIVGAFPDHPSEHGAVPPDDHPLPPVSPMRAGNE